MAEPAVPERFTIEREIGRGGMATVYLAVDGVTKTRVALKVLHPHLRSDELIAERFRREISAARRVRHPKVAEIHDLIESDELLCLVVQYHDGIDLKRLLRRRGKLTVEEAVGVMGQVLDGLAAAHEQGVVHRDVKPHNILVDDDLNVMLTDFGLARVDNLAGLTAHTMSLGTPEYMAPELFGSHYVDSRADIYAVGVTLFEVLTGELPFRAGTPLELLDKHRNDEAPRLRDVDDTLPEALDALVARALAKAPEDRFATPSEMRRALDGDQALAAVEVGGTTCRSCDAPLPPGLKICVECGAETIRITEGDQGEFRVFVPRPSNRITIRADYFDKLTFAQKSAMTDELRTLGGVVTLDGAKLDRRLRMTPIVLGHRLSKENAEQMRAALAHVGVETRVAPAGIRGKLTMLRQFALTEDLAKALIMGGGVAPLFALLGLAVTVRGRLGPEVQAGVLITCMVLTIALLVWVYVRNTRPLARFGGARGALTTSAALITRVQAVAAEVRSTRIRRLLRRILQRGLALRERLEADNSPLNDAVDNLMLVALRTGEHVGRLEAENGSIEPAIVLERMQALQEKIGVSEDIHEVEGWIEEVAAQRRLLETFDANYDEITRLTERLLEVSSELSRHLAELEIEQAGEVDLMSLSQVILDLGAEVEAAVEVDAVVTVEANE